MPANFLPSVRLEIKVNQNTMLYNVLLIVLIVVSVAMIVLIMMQQGKGADAGAAFGSGASGTVFGSRGSANFLSRTTGILATVFFLVALALAFLASGRTIQSGSIMDAATPAAVKTEVAPVAPANTDVPPAPTADKTDVPPSPAAKTDKPVETDKPAEAESKAETDAKPAADEKNPANAEKAVQDKKD